MLLQTGLLLWFPYMNMFWGLCLPEVILFFRLCLPDVLKVVALREPGFSLHKNHIGHIIKSVYNYGFPVQLVCKGDAS